jgi:S-adenosylmethionine hydrolase
MSVRPIITLTSDFGYNDTFVAELKGQILSVNPNVNIIDMSHKVPKQDVCSAAFIFFSAYGYFPPGTIHLVAVDSSVGDLAEPIAFQWSSHTFVGFDNGVFSYIFESAKAQDNISSLHAFKLAGMQYWAQRVSPTFRARDILAPVCGYISRGVSLESIGQEMRDLKTFPILIPEKCPDGSLYGHIIYIDEFGNIITDIDSSFFDSKNKVIVQIGETSIHGLQQAYPDVNKNELVALIGSSDHLEISVRNGNAANLLAARIGDSVKVVAIL